jgi:AcrR family transcriptional regulator
MDTKGPPRARAAPGGRARDREGTERAILSAALELLASEGFHAVGVNEVARRAGCDKQLIYRYFGGFDGLIERVGTELGRQFEEGLERHAEGVRPARYVELVERMMLALGRVFRENALLRAVTAWELAAPSPVVSRLVAGRARQLQAWVTRLRGDLSPPPHVDAPAANALLIAAVQQLALAAHASGTFAGVALKSDEHWGRVEAQLVALVRCAYGGDATPARSRRRSAP